MPAIYKVAPGTLIEMTKDELMASSEDFMYRSETEDFPDSIRFIYLGNFYWGDTRVLGILRLTPIIDYTDIMYIDDYDAICDVLMFKQEYIEVAAKARLYAALVAYTEEPTMNYKSTLEEIEVAKTLVEASKTLKDL